MSGIQEFLAVVRREVDETLDALLPQPDVEPGKLHQAIRWSVFAGGKRVRPALVNAVGSTFGAQGAKLVRTAVAVEMIHTYSLIHDDLPAMDDDELRRGRATCHRQFGEATAILAGDVLQTLAFKSIAEDEELAAEVRVQLISMLATAVGTPSGMVSGQQFDLDGEGKEISIEDLRRIHEQKTGALITAAACAGAIVGNAPGNELNAIDRFARKLGLLYQITDDVLDVTQGTEVLGKTAGKDAAAKKSTYISHYGIEETKGMAASVLKDALTDLNSIDRETSLLRDLAEAIANRTS